MTSLKRRFINNKNLKAYAEAKALLTDNIPSGQILDERCEHLATVFKDTDPVCLSNELTMLQKCRAMGSTDIPVFKSVENLMKFFIVSSEYRSLFAEVLKLGSLLTVVPATSATAERSFRCLKRVKTWL